MVTQGSATWPALAMVVVGLALAVLGLAILTGRGRRPWAPSSKTDAPPGPDTPSPPPPAQSPVVAPATVTPASAPTPSYPPEPVDEEPASPDDDGSPCDWELRIDVSDDQEPVVVREASARPCCVHVLRVRSLDRLPAPFEQEVHSWSGERTRIGPSRAVSDVRTDHRRVDPEVRGLDLALAATIARQDRRPVITTVEEAGADELGQTAAERLWEAHLARLRDANVVSDAEEGPARLQTASRHRTQVTLRTTRSCRTGGHRLDARADVSVDLDGEVTPAVGVRLTLPNVAGWVEGDLEGAATEPVEVSPGTEVHPAPGLDGAEGLVVEAAPGSGEIRSAFTGHAEHSVVDGGVDLLVACAVVADLGLGEAVGHSASEGRLSVAVAHRVQLVVTPHASHVGADEPPPSDLECSCIPAYELRFGVEPEGAPQTPHARLHVGGQSFRLDVDARPGTDRVPSWTVRAEAGDDEPPGGATG